MLKEIAQQLLDITDKGSYSNYKNHEKALEEYADLARKIQVAAEDTSYKTEAQDTAMDFYNDAWEAGKIIDKAINILPDVESEIESECQAWQEHQEYCQEIFNRR